MTVARKIVSGIIGALSLCAGIVSFLDFGLPTLHDLMPLHSGVIVYGRGSVPQRLFAALIGWGLTIGAFYMGFRFLRFLDFHHKP